MAVIRLAVTVFIVMKILVSLNIIKEVDDKLGRQLSIGRAIGSSR